MTRKPAANEARSSSRTRNPARLLALSAAISLALLGGAAHADPNPFARRGADPAAQAVRSAQQQGLQSVRAQQMAQRSLAAFGQAAQVRAALDAAQVAARVAAASSAAANQVPNGLLEGGLKVAAGVKFEPGAITANDPRLDQSKLWLGAKGPNQSADAAGNTTVTIEQTQKKAILTWETFNVGKQTTVYFDQRGGNQAGGGNDWIALNRIDDPSGRPSQIFGRIKAEGSVYLLNRNGVLFGGTSQVNTRSLLASSLNLFSNDIARSNKTFINNGIGKGNLVDYVLTSDILDAKSGPRPALAGDIRIDAGAQIKTGAGGYALIAAPNIDNAGSVQAEDGQAQLAAVLGAHYADPTLNVRNGENKIALSFGSVGADIVGRAAPDEMGFGRLTNTGIIASKRGDVTLTGYDIAQEGYVGTTTGVSRPGSLSILAVEYSRASDADPAGFAQNKGGRLRFGKGSATTILPEHDGETTTSAKSADQAFQPPSARLAAAQMFFQENSLVLMPGAKLNIFGLDSAFLPGAGVRFASRILIDRGATINVAGIADVQRPMSDNIVKIPRIGENELADSPLLRGGGLYRQSTSIDVRNKGATADGRAWVGTPLLNAAGYADQVPRGIDQMLINGGSINIQGRELIARSGSTLDLSGGYVHYLGGMIAAPRLLGADGRVYRQADADPNMVYVGFAGDYLLDHQRWGVKELFLSPLTSTDRYFDPDYLHGGDGGQLNVSLRADGTVSAIDSGLVLAGDIHADAESGRYQIKNGELAKGGSFKIGVGESSADFANWRLQAAPVSDVPDGFNMSSRFADLAAAAKDASGLRTAVLSSDRLNAAGFSSITLNDSQAQIEVAADAHLKVEDGGSIALNGRRLQVDGTLEAVSGKIDLDAVSGDKPQRSDIVLGAQARLLARGAWVNDGAGFDAGQTGAAHIDGGAISLTTHERRSVSGDATTDASGSILIDPNARLDVSGGGRVLPNGQLAQKNGVPLGRGGDISLRTYVGAASGIEQVFPAAYYGDAGGAGRLLFSRDSLVAHNLGGGGTLRLDAREIRIGGEASTDPRLLNLGADFFADGDFGAYDLRAELGASIAAGSDVRVSQRSFLGDPNALRNLASGADIYADGFGAFGRLDDSRRTAADFSMMAGGSVGTAISTLPLKQLRDELRIEQGARLSVDAGGDVRLGSRGQVTVLGEISARGGSITLTGDTTLDGLSSVPTEMNQPYWTRDKSVWLGANSKLDVSGIALIDPLVAPRADGSVPRNGKLLGGGKITLSNDGGYVVVEQGAQLKLDGASDRFDVRNGSAVPGRDPFSATAVWSDAGSLTIGAAGGLFFDGAISAYGGGARTRGGGAAQARGGVVELVALGGNLRRLNNGSDVALLNASEFVIDAGGSHLAASARPGGTIEPDRAAPSGQLRFGADRLQGSGVDTLQIGRPGSVTFVPIVFEGNVDLHLDRALIMNASGYSVRPAGADSAAAQAKLSAQYVAFNGLRSTGRGDAPLSDPLRPGDNRLDVSAGFIDFAGQVRLDGIKYANFDSAGDIRFYTPAQFRGYTPPGVALPVDLPGQLLSGGDLNFRASQLYPGTGERFIIRALGASDGAGGRDATRISIVGNGKSAAAPMSAGGALLLDATAIEQGGVLRAPGGQIVLGAGDPNNADTRAAFGNLNLTATQRVELKSGSLTSVSLDGRVLPYGVTVDGLQWQASSTQTDLAAPPRKQITLDASSMALADGAVIDLSGGGDLQAVEWVPGTGGSRDVLSRYNTSYADGTPKQVPLYPDEREVYAILPGAQPQIAPSDPSFGNGAIGKQVQISGVPGLPDGLYTLLPGRYATLPGAFRVVQRGGVRETQSGPAVIAPDGTAVVAGFMVDALTGARDALASNFEVQSKDTWSRYSQYAYSSADKFFSDRAQRNSAVAPQLPRDGGQLVLNAGQTLDLGATLKAAAAPGGAAAQVDIAAKAIQIVGAGHAARDGYVQLDADKLNRLGAGSLLIGGQRRDRADGLAVDVRADSVVVDNDAASALKAPEIALVANRDVRVSQGSVVSAQGQLSGSSDKPLLIGEDAANAQPGRSGDGALLRVSNAGPAEVQRRNLPSLANSRGVLAIEAGANVDGGASLTLDAARNTLIDSKALLHGRDVQANSGLIVFAGDGANTDLDGFVIGRNTLTGFADAQRIGLRSYGRMEFHGAVDVNVAQELALSAAAFAGDGGNVRLRADRLSLSNELATPVTAKSGSGGTLSLSGREVVFGRGDKSVDGFSRVDVQADQRIAVSGKGGFDFGAAPLSLSAPLIQADAGADGRLSSQGEISLVRGAGAVVDNGAQGGAIELSAGRIVGDALIRANAGRITLRADGDVSLNGAATLDVSARAKTLFDQKLMPPAGRIELNSAHGSLRLGEGTALDFSAPSGGDAGVLRASAGEGAIELAGALRGGSPKGRGGSIELDSAQALALDPLAQRLASSGINERIAVRTRSGNLDLSAGNSLKAREVSLIADAGAGVRGSDANNGHINIAGTIDASGTAGGTIELYGRQGVDVDGRLIATGSDAKRRGGEIRIGVSGVGDGTLNSNYGYQNVQREDSGAIRIGANAVLDVSGGSAGGLSGGRIDLRAPLLVDGDVRVDIADPASIRGAREVSLEAYAAWSAADAQDPARPELHFDGIVDPAGWYDAQGKLLAGKWTDASGTELTAPQNAEELAKYLSKYYFAPDAANAAHRTFYGYNNDSPADAPRPGTLMGFVQNPGFTFEQRFTGVQNFRARPGIELRNPDDGINGGAIRVLTNWNLNSGTAQRLDFRYGDRNSAPVITLRASEGVEIAASVSDGFYDFSNFSGGVSGERGASRTLYGDIVLNQRLDDLAGAGFISLPDDPDPSLYDADQIAQYYGQYDKLMQELSKPDPTFSADLNFCGFSCSLLQWIQSVYGFASGTSPDPALQPPPAPTSPADYDAYLVAYRNYVVALANHAIYDPSGEVFAYELPKLPVPGALLPRIGPDDRTPSLQASASNPAPFASRVLAGGDSSSLRVIAGADSASASPTALRAQSIAADIRFDGHTTVARPNGRELLLPNVLRTGTGGIELVAARDIVFADKDAPASVYTAGRPGDGTTASQTPGQIKPLGNNRPDLMITGQVNPEAAGDLVLDAGRDIVGNRQIFDNQDGTRSGTANNYLGQYWWPWMQSGNTIGEDLRTVLASSINFGGFAQGLLSVGGNVSVSAGRDIKELSVSLPTTWSRDSSGATHTYGGGDLRVDAGRDILGGDYFVAKGEGDLRAGGRIGSAFDFSATVFTDRLGARTQLNTPVAPILAMQDARIRVQAAQDVELGRVLNPSYVVTPDGVLGDSQAYGADAELNVFSVAGSIAFDTLNLGDALFSYGLRLTSVADKPYYVPNKPIFMQALPGRVLATAMDGDITLNNGGALFPSARGQLSLLAGGDLLLSANRLPVVQGLTLIDLDPNWMPTPDNQIGKALGQGNGPLVFDDMLLSNGNERSYRANLHRDDPDPVRLYAGGDIVAGNQRDGVSLNPLLIDVPKPASIRAGRDIVDLNFRGQNYRESDLTRIEAGRDLYNNPLRLQATGTTNTAYAWLQIGGPGTFELQAGRNFGRITSANEALLNRQLTSDGGGVRTIGNRDNAGLPNEGADIVVRFGVGPGVATDAFAQRYLDPSSNEANPYRDWLVAFIAKLDADRRQHDGADAAPLSAEQAWQAFLQQPAEQRQLLVDRVFLDVLERAGKENKDPASPNFGKYALGYQAINTLFPAAAGYTANRLEGGANGADRLVSTGQLDMRGSTIQTQRGGDIRILGPGGDVLVGSVSAPPLVRDNAGKVLIGPNQQGILALEQGDISIFTDRSVLLAQSRIFTQQGGKMLIWSSNGDINAGKGAKTSSDKPPVAYDCDLDNYCRLDAKGLVTGAGIATLQTVPGGKAADAVLVAPRGTIDAGDAGIRISGNLILAAQSVANADNIQVDGDSIGIPVARGVDGGALAAASSANAGVDAAADAMAEKRPAVATRDIPALISVQVIGFGRCGVDDSRCMNPPPP